MKRKSPTSFSKPRTKNNKTQLKSCSSLSTRRMWGNPNLGVSRGGNRDLYNSCGWFKNITYDMFCDMYERNILGGTVVDLQPTYTWDTDPIITPATRKPKIKNTLEQINENVGGIWTNLMNGDILSRIGNYAVVVLGFNDGKGLEEPVTSATDVLYMKPYSQQFVDIKEWETNPTSPRFGLPKLYQITFNVGNTTTNSMLVHWTRVIHCIDNTKNSCWWSESVLKKPFNTLQDIEKVSGASAEMYFKSASTGLFVGVQEGYSLTEEQKTAIMNDLMKWEDDLSRAIVIEGGNVTPLYTKVTNPQRQHETLLKNLCGITQTPIGFYNGGKVGETEFKMFASTIETRRVKQTNSIYIKPFLNRLMVVGVLPKTKYDIEWSPVEYLTAMEKAEIAERNMNTISTYVSSGVNSILPPEILYTNILRMSPNRVEEILAMIDNNDLNNVSESQVEE